MYNRWIKMSTYFTFKFCNKASCKSISLVTCSCLIINRHIVDIFYESKISELRQIIILSDRYKKPHFNFPQRAFGKLAFEI